MFQLQQLPCSNIRSWKPRLEGIIMMDNGQAFYLLMNLMGGGDIIVKANKMKTFDIFDLLKQ